MSANSKYLPHQAKRHLIKAGNIDDSLRPCYKDLGVKYIRLLYPTSTESIWPVHLHYQRKNLRF